MKGWLLRLVTIVVASGAMLTGAYGEVIPESHPKAQLAKKVLFEFLDCLPKRHAAVLKAYADRWRGHIVFKLRDDRIRIDVGDIWAEVYDSTEASHAVKPRITMFHGPSPSSILANILKLDPPEMITEDEMKEIVVRMISISPNPNYEHIIEPTTGQNLRNPAFRITWKFKHSHLIPSIRSGSAEFDKTDGSLIHFDPWMPIRVATIDPSRLVPKYTLEQIKQIAIDDYLAQKPFVHATFGGHYQFGTMRGYKEQWETLLTPEDEARIESWTGTMIYYIGFQEQRFGRDRVNFRLIDTVEGRTLGRYQWSRSLGLSPPPDLQQRLGNCSWRAKIAPLSPALRFERTYQPHVEFTRQVALISDLGDIILADANEPGTYIRLHKDWSRWFVLGGQRIPESANLRATIWAAASR